MRDEALHRGDPLLVLQAHALDAVVALIPATAAVFASVTRRQSIDGGVAVVERGASVDRDELRIALRGTDPFGPRLLSPLNTTVLALEHVEARVPGYAKQLAAAGWADRLAMYLRLAGTIVGVLSLLRAAGRARFHAGDASQLRRIHPLLEQVYGSALDPGSASARDVLRGSGLTAREADVAELIGRGASNAEIARSLHVSEATVKTHLTRIYTKVGVRTRTQLALLVGGLSTQTFG
jgi:DNA-binding CsgD family transcriptional regulator